MVSWVTPVRGVQLICAVIVLGLAGHIIAEYPVNFDTGNFNIFTALWTILVCAYFIVTGFMPDSIISSTIVCLAVDGLTWIFWLAAFAAMAAKLNSDVPDFVFHRFGIDGDAKAAVAFGVINWVLFSVTLVWNGLTGFRGKPAAGSTA